MRSPLISVRHDPFIISPVPQMYHPYIYHIGEYFAPCTPDTIAKLEMSAMTDEDLMAAIDHVESEIHRYSMMQIREESEHLPTRRFRYDRRLDAVWTDVSYEGYGAG